MTDAIDLLKIGCRNPDGIGTKLHHQNLEIGNRDCQDSFRIQQGALRDG